MTGAKCSHKLTPRRDHKWFTEDWRVFLISLMVKLKRWTSSIVFSVIMLNVFRLITSSLLSMVLEQLVT